MTRADPLARLPHYADRMTVQSVPGSVREAVRRTPAYPFTPIDAPVKLDQNESALDFPAELKAKALERMAALDWNRYPDLHADTLRGHIAASEGWDPEGVVVTPGSNVLIKLLTELAGIAQTVLTVQPGFSLYQLEASMLGARLVQPALNPNFSLPLEALEEALGTNPPGLFYLTQPHAPTGHLDPPQTVRRAVEAAGPGWVTVIDEAYCQFAGSDFRELVRAAENRLSLRTFSKAWGLAGLRLGYALTSPALATELRKLVSAFNVNLLTAAAVQVALEHPEYLRARVAAVRAERERVYAALREHPSWTVYPSHTNFLLIRTPDAGAAYRGLLERGVLLRRQDKLPGLAGCLRLSIGTPQENDRFLEAARQLA